MALSRRQVLAIGSGAVAITVIGLPAYPNLAREEIAKLTGGATPSEGGVMITAPEIAENGNTVPIAVEAPGAKVITLYADGNPAPKVATINFGPLSAARSASTRIRMAKSQNVLAVAEMEDGSFKMASAAVKVTIGGCGG